MIIRETRILECWCPSCHEGQMEPILMKSFEEKKHISDYIGDVFRCEKCGEENILEDFISLIPTSFQIASKINSSKSKSNEEIKKHLES